MGSDLYLMAESTRKAFYPKLKKLVIELSLEPCRNDNWQQCGRCLPCRSRDLLSKLVWD